MATNDSMITSSWNAGDGYSYPSYLSGYDYSNQDYTVPLFGSSGYSLDPNNSLLYTNSSDALGAVPNYSSPTATAESFSPGGSNALGTLGGSLGGMGNTAGAIGSGVSAISNAYNGASTDTTGSVLSGAASGAATGAAIGSVVPVIGTAIGAVAGAIIGGIAGFFGSKSKKKAEQKAFQQKEQLAVLPYQQEQANYLQKQGLLQQAIGNYKSAYTPGGYQFTNSLLGGPTNKMYGVPTAAPSLPNFNQAPPNVVPGSGDKSLGINGYSLPNNGVNLNPGAIQPPGQGQYTGGATNPYYGFTQPAPAQVPTAPSFVKDPAQQQAVLSDYQKQYQQYVQQQQQQMAAASMQAYQPYFASQPGYTNGVYA